MQWKDVPGAIAKLAPTIAGIVGGPLASTGVQALESVLGLTPSGTMDSRQSAIATAMQQSMTPDQIIALKKADADLKATLINGGVRLEEIAASDRDSARKRQIALRDVAPDILAGIVVVAAICGEGYALTHQIPTGSDVIVGRVLGTLDSALMLVLAFFFGSSSGSAAKNAILDKAINS